MDRATEEDFEQDADRPDGFEIRRWVDGTVDEALGVSASPCTDDGSARYCGVRLSLTEASRQ